MAYSLQLLALECMQPQELDGDETYLTLDGRQVWSAGEYRMSRTLAAANRCSQVDFAAGRVLTRDGWVDVEQEPMVFPGLAGQVMAQLWDSDSLTSDDLLGETPISETDSGRGKISVQFTRDGGIYRLTYAVNEGL